MKSQIFEIVSRLARKFDYKLEKMSDPNAVLELLEKLTPHETGLDLIRVGGDHDGGYLIPNDLSEIQSCVSPGCDKKIQFELDLFEKFGITSLLIDKVDGKPQLRIDAYEFIEKWVGPFDSEEYISLASLLERTKAGDIILQMDIEGAEYRSLLATSEKDLSRFRIMVIEFHFMSLIKNRTFLEYTASLLFEKLLTTHVIVHAHPNNAVKSWTYHGLEYPEVIELTFLRRDRIRSLLKKAKLPNELDQPNIPGNLEPRINLKTDHPFESSF